MYSQDDLVPLSALQHMVFCERQAALIHLEGLWEENTLTVQGRQLHEHVHEEGAIMLHDIRTVRNLKVRSLQLGLTGATDVVEFTRVEEESSDEILNFPRHIVTLAGESGFWQPKIIEYKRGKSKTDRSDEVQLCAQAICLEEMLGIDIRESYLFYGQPRRRQFVLLDEILRELTAQTAARFHEMITTGKTPTAVYNKKCKSCSLLELCMPKTTGAKRDVRKYIETSIFAGGE